MNKPKHKYNFVGVSVTFEDVGAILPETVWDEIFLNERGEEPKYDVAPEGSELDGSHSARSPFAYPPPATEDTKKVILLEPAWIFEFDRPIGESLDPYYTCGTHLSVDQIGAMDAYIESGYGPRLVAMAKHMLRGGKKFCSFVTVWEYCDEKIETWEGTEYDSWDELVGMLDTSRREEIEAALVDEEEIEKGNQEELELKEEENA